MDVGEQADTPSTGGGRVVVGVDGSPGSRGALRYALTAGSRRGAELELVASYAAELYWMTGAPVAFRDLAGIREDTEKRTLDLLHEVAGRRASRWTGARARCRHGSWPRPTRPPSS